MIAMSENETTPEEQHGISCPRCGCRDLRYSYHRIVFGKKRQVKFCRHCGRKVTVEVVEKVLDDPRQSENRPIRDESQPQDAYDDFTNGEVPYD